ncbi:SDR family NAD(P)-dependent oxidoreductase [Streptomyces sp. NPDC048484]|uniref:SDR family NAD(P)-dependent oxidoreductase n=1 Tax=Streptomyces sp. NPDC048484 TaxID=3155146 RepID=UPI0034160718
MSTHTVTQGPGPRVALVTGGASGIGAACAQRLADDGYTVVVADIDEPGAERTARSVIATGGAARARPVDVSQAGSVASLADWIVDAYGSLYAVVNCAGVTGPLVYLADYPLDAFASVIGTNLCGVFHTMRQCIPVLRDNGGGVVVNVASVAGHTAQRAHSPYVAAKHAVIGLTKAAAREYARDGIRVVSVSPGLIDTPMTAGLAPDVLAGALDDVPARRMGHPREVAAAVAFLVSDDARYVTGSDHPVDGGYLTS